MGATEAQVRSARLSLPRRSFSNEAVRHDRSASLQFLVVGGWPGHGFRFTIVVSISLPAGGERVADHPAKDTCRHQLPSSPTTLEVAHPIFSARPQLMLFVLPFPPGPRSGESAGADAYVSTSACPSLASSSALKRYLADSIFHQQIRLPLALCC
jgi:hypothetical protein